MTTRNKRKNYARDQRTTIRLMALRFIVHRYCTDHSWEIDPQLLITFLDSKGYQLTEVGLKQLCTRWGFRDRLGSSLYTTGPMQKIDLSGKVSTRTLEFADDESISAGYKQSLRGEESE